MQTCVQEKVPRFLRRRRPQRRAPYGRIPCTQQSFRTPSPTTISICTTSHPLSTYPRLRPPTIRHGRQFQRRPICLIDYPGSASLSPKEFLSIISTHAKSSPLAFLFYIQKNPDPDVANSIISERRSLRHPHLHEMFNSARTTTLSCGRRRK